MKLTSTSVASLMLALLQMSQVSAAPRKLSDLPDEPSKQVAERKVPVGPHPVGPRPGNADKPVSKPPTTTAEVQVKRQASETPVYIAISDLYYPPGGGNPYIYKNKRQYGPAYTTEIGSDFTDVAYSLTASPTIFASASAGFFDPFIYKDKRQEAAAYTTEVRPSFTGVYYSLAASPTLSPNEQGELEINPFAVFQRRAEPTAAPPTEYTSIDLADLPGGGNAFIYKRQAAAGPEQPPAMTAAPDAGVVPTTLQTVGKRQTL